MAWDNHWGDALTAHLRAAGITLPKQLKAAVGVSHTTVHRWYDSETFPARMHREHSDTLCKILGLDGREALKRLTMIPPPHGRQISEDLRKAREIMDRIDLPKRPPPRDPDPSKPRPVDWTQVEPRDIPRDKIIAALVLRGVTPETLERVLIETRDESDRAARRDAREAQERESKAS